MLHNYILFGLVACSRLVIAKEEKNNSIDLVSLSDFMLCFFLIVHFIIATGSRQEDHTDNW